MTFDRAEFARGRGVHQVAVNATSPGADFKQELPNLERQENWKLFYRGSAVIVQKVTVERDVRTILLDFDPESIALPEPGSLEDGELAAIYQPPNSAPTVILNRAFMTSVTAGVALTADKKDADIDIAGGFQAGANARPEYFWSVQAVYPIPIAYRYGTIAPVFIGEASQQRNADPDSLKAGVLYDKRWPISGRSGFAILADLLAYEFERKINKEAVLIDGEIVKGQSLEKNSNLMWTASLRYINGWRHLNFTLGFAGFEVGKSLSRTVKQASREDASQTVARPKFDVDAYKVLFGGERRLLTFDGHYTVRFPLTQEPFLKAEENGGKMYLTAVPRHWLNLNVGLLLTDGVDILAQYKYGSLPPSFEFVDHQVTVGFNLLLRKK